jgi:hypothetical protein
MSRTDSLEKSEREEEEEEEEEEETIVYECGEN